ncbi:Uncharacterised protein [Mycobacterium tuberculosis]|nr:Uncharacterised protein [Mycobacterium tuberculosis]
MTSCCTLVETPRPARYVAPAGTFRPAWVNGTPVVPRFVMIARVAALVRLACPFAEGVAPKLPAASSR